MAVTSRALNLDKDLDRSSVLLCAGTTALDAEPGSAAGSAWEFTPRRDA